jgi:hypothetical protein
MAENFVKQPIVVGSTPEFTLTARRSGEPWDLTGGAVKLYLRDPDGIVLGPYTATLDDPTAGGAVVQVAADVIDAAGVWRRQWRVEAGDGAVAWSTQIRFPVESALA